MRSVFAASMALTVFCSGALQVPAADQTSGVASLFPSNALTCPDALLRGCCGNYCPKPTPCISGFGKSCCPDVYCPKPCPFIPCIRSGCGVTYCPKPCPDLCRPLAADFFVCVPDDGCSAGAARCASRAILSTSESTIADSPYGRTDPPPSYSPPPLRQ
jgi:hypothetical protein